MANIRTLDLTLVDDLFEMGAGYVLDFSDRTMSSFFAEELNVGIDDDVYREQGTPLRQNSCRPDRNLTLAVWVSS